MSPLQLGAVVGVIVAAAVWSTAIGLRRAPRSLAVARHRMYGSGFADPAGLVGHGPTGWSGRARWRVAVEDSAASRWVAGRFGAGLVVADLTPADVVTRVVAAAGLLLFSTLAGVVALTAGGLLPPSPLWLVFALVDRRDGGLGDAQRCPVAHRSPTSWAAPSGERLRPTRGGGAHHRSERGGSGALRSRGRHRRGFRSHPRASAHRSPTGSAGVGGHRRHRPRL